MERDVNEPSPKIALMPEPRATKVEMVNRAVLLARLMRDELNNLHTEVNKLFNAHRQLTETYLRECEKFERTLYDALHDRHSV